MIAIPNMNMPKSCVKCHWYYELYDELCTLGDFLLREYPTDVSEEPYTLDTQRHPDCLLIDIVRCGECKHRDPEDKKCDCGMFERQGCIFPVSDDYFCKYGERKE